MDGTGGEELRRQGPVGAAAITPCVGAVSEGPDRSFQGSCAAAVTSRRGREGKAGGANVVDDGAAQPVWQSVAAAEADDEGVGEQRR